MGMENAGSSSTATAPGHENAPPLPPRPAQTSGNDSTATTTTIEGSNLQSKPTTAISSMNIQTLSFPDGSRGTFSTTNENNAGDSEQPTPANVGMANIGFNPIAGDIDESMSVMSIAPTLRPPGDLESLLVGDGSKKSAAWTLLRSQYAAVPPFESIKLEEDTTLANFADEFDDIPDESEKNWNDEDRVKLWKSKLKHFMILSSAGKPIYSRHGDLGLINSSMGVVQTIISFYEGAKNPLLGFTAGNTRFVIATEGPLYFVAISKLGESDSQLRAQLDALYMQILSTLTLPALTNIFANRPSTDLRKPLQGTESLLSSLADSFTRGSPSALLGALECLRLRKSHRHAINNAFLRTRTEKLLYGLIVAGGKLVSVIRPRRHSLHPSDLQLIFNMLFESGGVKAGGGENWIPLCLPAFNNRGYLYMYVSFLDAEPESERDLTAAGEETAVILISTDKESFFDLQQMRDDVVVELKKKGHLDIIKTAVQQGRAKMNDIAPGTHISHFLFKSRANVQFCMPSLLPTFSSLVSHRRLMSLYHNLHSTLHAKHTHVKVLHCVGEDSTSLAWITPIFEFYCVAGPNASRAVITQGANKIIQWAKREEERLFIIGGGVF
ncbi:vacuolar fusion protein MON1 [Annulohypoxylon maeteangense]|uniref:vacuolar fusion protein MON1 n=1 Tax=Annulohypoxylon maeteangense TaxID=1927788 RepID=UPI0020078BB0|nr:vacuolar fusion protein MON1 [Annulohypoxylon maeteangense]KAI0890409.1 vacuolar fusion protein MON1 [Annulohypoxylon maeteangense]